MADFDERMLDFVLRHYETAKLDTRAAFEGLLASHGLSRRNALWPRIAGIAAAVAVVVTLGALLLPRRSAVTTLTAEGEVLSAVLPDGSEVQLGPGSSLSYGRNPREVTLDGLARFEVKRDTARPFEVSFPGKEGFVRVLGTRFVVRTLADCVRVDVEDGRVLLGGGGRETVLSRGEAGIIGEGPSRRLARPSLNPSAWLLGVFRYEDAPLQDVLDELSDFYDCRLVASDYACALTGTFEAEPLEDIVPLIEDALDIKITILR